MKNELVIIDSYDKAKKLTRSGEYTEAKKILAGLESKITDDKLLILVQAELLRIEINLGEGREREIVNLLRRAREIDFTKGC